MRTTIRLQKSTAHRRKVNSQPGRNRARKKDRKTKEVELVIFAVMSGVMTPILNRDKKLSYTCKKMGALQ